MLRKNGPQPWRLGNLETELRLRRADGNRWFLLRAVPRRDERGNIFKWYGTSSDIEDLKRAEDRIRLIIDTLPMMAWTVRSDGAVDFVNRRWLDLYGTFSGGRSQHPTQRTPSRRLLV